MSGSGFDAGTYEIILYLGDFSIEDSMEWVLGDLNFKVSGGAEQAQSKQTPSSPNHLFSISYDTKPEIKVREITQLTLSTHIVCTWERAQLANPIHRQWYSLTFKV